MRPNSIFLYMYDLPDSAPTTITQVAQGFYINIPILWCFGAQTSCLISFSLIATFSFLFSLLCSLYYLHFLLRLIIEFFSPGIAIASILICILVLFRSLLLYHLHERKQNEGRKPRYECTALTILDHIASHQFLHNLREMKEESRTIHCNKIMAVSSLYYIEWFLQMLGWILEWHVGTINMISSCLFTNLKVLESWLLNQHIKIH